MLSSINIKVIIHGKSMLSFHNGWSSVARFAFDNPNAEYHHGK